jgi:two-component system OmpR family sensor kinase
MLQTKRLELSDFANEQILKLKALHVNFENDRVYPRDTRFESAIFDSSKKEIFSTFDFKQIALDEVIYLQNRKIYFIKEPESYYLGTKFLVLQVPSDASWHQDVSKNILFYGAGFFLVMMSLGYFLMKLFLKPMRDAIELLDRFIKDTTHELNTPVNAIISNIEMIDKNSLDEKLAKKINRIDIGARTVSNLYQDLTYLVLSHKIISHNEQLDLAQLLKERVEYFELFANSRKIEITLDIKANPSLHVDRKKMAKLIDNLLSNAIKYNKLKGDIKITLLECEFRIKDSGKGIAKDKIKEIFQRYKRVDTTVGGFGIGLSIVMMIANEYKMQVSMDSCENEWTEVSVKWES